MLSLLQHDRPSLRTMRAWFMLALFVASAGPLAVMIVGDALLERRADSQALWLAGLTFLVSVALIALASARLADRLTERLRALAAAARALEAGVDQIPVPPACLDDGEVGPLAEAFAGMSTRRCA